MKNSSKITFITIIFSILTACGGSGGESKKSSTENNSTTVSAGNNANSIAVNPGENPSAVNQPATADQLEAKKSQTQQLTVGGGNDTPPDPNTKVIEIDPKKAAAANPAMTLGDGSQISTVLGAQGAVETRTFKNNPQLAKLERTTQGNETAVKVFLKNGKVVPIAKDKIQNFTNDSPEQILRAAGIEPKAAPQNNQTKEKSGEKTYTLTFPVKPAN